MKTFHRVLLESKLMQHINTTARTTLDAGSMGRRYDKLLKYPSVAIDIVPNPDRNVLFGDVSKLTFKDEFDQIICIEVLEYLSYESFLNALGCLTSALKKGGICLITLPLSVADHGERIRYTPKVLNEIIAPYQSDYRCSLYTFGNAFTVGIDTLILMYNNSRKQRRLILLRIIFGLFLKSIYFIVKQSQLCNRKDLFYSGILIKIEKN